MQTREAAGRPAPAGRVRFLVISRPEWLLSLLLVVLFALAAWLALHTERARRQEILVEAPAVPAMAPVASGSGVASGRDTMVPPQARPVPEAVEVLPNRGGGMPDPGGMVPDVQRVAAVSVGPAPAGTRLVYAYEEYRLERERVRSRQLASLEAMVRDPAVSDDARREAQQRLLALWDAEVRETQLENILRAQGFDAVVIVSGAGAHVVVDAILDAAQAQHIGELISRMAGVRREAVSIVDAVSAGR